MGDMAEVIDLRRVGSLREVPAVTAEETVRLYAGRVPMIVPEPARAALDAWADHVASGRASADKGPGRSPAEQAGLVGFLREKLQTREPFTFNALRWEQQGGRRYPFFVADYDGPLTMSRRAHEETSGLGRRHLLSAMKKDVRRALAAGVGWQLVEVDYRSCHAGLAAAVAGDEALFADIAAGMHEVVGARFAPHLPPESQRALGKELNNKMLFGATAAGVAEVSKVHLGRPPADGTGEAVAAAWWRQYPKLALFRDAFRAAVTDAQAHGRALEVVAPSGRTSRFPAAEVLGAVGKGREPVGREGVWRTVFSALFRAIEGDLLDVLLRRFIEENAGGQPVLPVYDALIVAAPAARVDDVAAALRRAAEGAAEAIGAPRLRASIRA